MPIVATPIVPGGSSFPGMDDTALKGGFRSVADIAARDAIHENLRKIGMRVYVQSTDEVYRLRGDLNTYELDTPDITSSTVSGLSEDDNGTANGLAIQTAIDNANDGDIIKLPAGTYKTTMITLNKSVYLQGSGGGTTLVNPTAGNYAMTLIYVRGTNNSSTFTTLTRAAKPGDNTVYVASTSGLTAGQWILVKDSRTMEDWNGQDTVNMDLVKIESVVSSTELRLRSVLTRTYLVNRSAQLLTFSTPPPSVTIENIKLSRGRIDLNYAADSFVRNCQVEQSEFPGFALSNCTNCLVEDCRTEWPNARVAATNGHAFYFYNSSFCTVSRHTSRWCEGAVLRRGTRYCKVVDCRFEGATTGLATYSGDCHHNVAEGCMFVDSVLTWGACGHYSDSYNVSRNCTFMANNTTANVIGNGNSAIAEHPFTFNGRSLVIGSDTCHGFENGQGFITYGTTVPNELTKMRRYFAICPTYRATTWGKEFLASDRLPKPMVAVTFDNTNKDVDMGSGWATGDAVVLDGPSIPTGLATNRIYFLRNRTGSKYYLQIRPAQTVAFDHANDRVTITGAGTGEWVNGDAIMFVTTGGLPTELSAAPSVYYLRDKSGDDSFKLAASVGGAAIALSSNGSGTIYAVCGMSTAGSGVITAYGGTPISLTGSTSAATLTTSAEGNVFEGHVIHEPPANVVYMQRHAGTLFKNLTMSGARNPDMGSCMFTLLAGTDVVIEDCHDTNGLNTTYNRIAHFTSCFEVRFLGGKYSKRSTGQLITGGSSENIILNNVSLPLLTSIDNLFGPSISPNARASFSPELVETMTYAASKTIHLGIEVFRKITLTGDLTLTGTGYVAGSTVKIRIDPGSSDRNLSFPAAWVFVPNKPSVLSANKIGMLTLHSSSTTDTGVTATWSVQSDVVEQVDQLDALAVVLGGSMGRDALVNGGTYATPASGTPDWIINADQRVLTVGNQWRIKRDMPQITKAKFYFGSKTNITGFWIDIWRVTAAGHWYLVDTTQNLIDAITADSLNELVLPNPLIGARAGDYYGWGLTASSYPVTPLVTYPIGSAGNRSTLCRYKQGTITPVYDFWASFDGTINDLALPMSLYGPPAKILAIGDSLTAGSPGTRSLVEAAISPYFDLFVEGHQYSKYVGDILGMSVQNVGISSQNDTQVYSRFAADVIANRPQIVLIEVGTNNIGGVTPDKNAFLQNCLDMGQAALDAGIIPVFLQIAPRRDWCTEATYWASQMRRDWNASQVVALQAEFGDRVIIWNQDATLGKNYAAGDPGNLDDLQDAYKASTDNVHLSVAGYTAKGTALGNYLKTFNPA